MHLLKGRVEARKIMSFFQCPGKRQGCWAGQELCSLARLRLDVLSQPSPATTSVSITVWFLGKSSVLEYCQEKVTLFFFWRKLNKKREKKIKSAYRSRLVYFSLTSPETITLHIWADCHLYPKIALLGSSLPCRSFLIWLPATVSHAVLLKKAVDLKVGCKVSAKMQGKHPASMPGGFPWVWKGGFSV